MTSGTHLLHSETMRAIAIGFGYWFCFLIALEPGLALRAAGNGTLLAWTAEMARIVGASMLGALASPVVLHFLRRFPSNAPLTAAVIAARIGVPLAIAFLLIAASCLLAPLAQIGDTRPFWTALPDHLASNWLLMSFVIGGLSVVFQVLQSRKADASEPSPGGSRRQAHPSQLHIKTRGHVTVVDLATVDWIEAQGNYVALHIGSRSHLLRETLSALEERLDPAQFVRIHRSTLVAPSRVARVMPSSNGDATLWLADGTELRVSRRFRSQLRDRMADPMA